MPSDLSDLQDPREKDLDLAKQALTKIKDSSVSVTADPDVKTTIYDFDDFWIVRDRPPYFV